MLEYYKSIDSDIDLYTVSLDRSSYISENTSTLKRLFFGIKDHWNSLREARRIIKTKHPDIVHICSSASLGLIKDYLIIMMAKRNCAKSIIHFRFGRIPELIHSNNWEAKLIKLVIKSVNAVITIDERSYCALERNGISNVKYCPNPLFLPVLNKIEELQVQTKREKGRIVFIGHVVRTKGIFELVESCESCQSISLRIVGKVEPVVKMEIEALASKKEQGKWLHFVGEVSHDEVLKELLSASIFALPTYTEGFPNVILEAMACECPIVTTSVGAIPEMLDIKSKNNCGICVEPQNTQAFADGLKQMMSDPGYAARCAERAKKRVNEMYAIPVVWEQLTQIWRNA